MTALARGRTILALSTGCCLCGLFALYSVFLGPYLSPGVEKLSQPGRSGKSVSPPAPPENRRQAEQYLFEHAWAADAKYQLHTDHTWVFAEEWEKVEETGRVRFRPFAMIWRARDHDAEKPPVTLVCESAQVEFSGGFDVTNPRPGRVIGGALEGFVRIRGPDGLAVDCRDVNFSESALRVWSDGPVTFAWGPHTGHGLGIELDLIPSAGPPGEDKPAIEAVRTVRLRKDVQMDLVSREGGRGRAPERVAVSSAGSFEYEIESHVATFQNEVRVRRPTHPGQADTLFTDLLTLVFEPDAAGGPPPVSDKVARRPVTEEPAGDVQLQFRRLRAEGPRTRAASEHGQLEARMSELTYDAQARVVVLRDEKRVRLTQKNNDLTCPEVTAVLDDDGEIERAVCRGSGKLVRYAEPGAREGTAAQPGRRPVEFTASWHKQLRMEPDPRSGLTLIDLEGRAQLAQQKRMNLKGETVRIWVTPDQRSEQSAPRGEGDALPRRVLALGDVSFVTPQIKGQTPRLEIWFEEGPLPAPRTPKAGAPAARHNVARPAAHRASLKGARRGQPGDVVPAYEQETRTEKPLRPRIAGSQPEVRPASGKKTDQVDRLQTSEQPLSVTADLIRVRAMHDAGKTEVAEVITEGHVHVSQPHDRGEPPLDMTGERLHLWNYSEAHQVLHVEGRPAEIRDRGLQLEGTDIHLDRALNEARVNGGGVLRLPVRNNLDGKPLESPRLLDIFWQEQMVFDGEIARFYRGVRTQLDGHEMRCEEMHVTLTERISFAQDARQSRGVDVRLIKCRDGVQLKSHEYQGNRLVGVRVARGFEFSFNQSTGDVGAQGPGTLLFWRRGGANRAGLSASSGARANKPLATETIDWEYTRIDFSGRMSGNSKSQTTSFSDRVRIVYGPVERVNDTVDEDNLPRHGGWMRCDKLTLTQHAAAAGQDAWVDILGQGNAELEGRSDHGLFHALADNCSFDQSKGLYILSSNGRQNATITREDMPGGKRDTIEVQRAEFNPSRNELKFDRASGVQGLR